MIKNLQNIDKVKIKKINSSNDIIIFKPKVIIVDDDDEIRSLLAKFLTIHQYQVSTAGNTTDLEEMLSITTFDIMILDVMLPKESGITYLANNRHKLIMPVIILTAMGTADDKVNSIEIGADDYIAKPFEPKDLLKRMKILLKQK